MSVLIKIEFSGSTYHLELQEKRYKYWVFIQFNDKDEVQDAFCSCDDDEDDCAHVKLALSSVYNGQKEPLHKRFKSSLWHTLCKHYSERFGYDSKILQKVASGHYALEEKSVFAVKITKKPAPANIQSIFRNRKEETETNSLKFSNLPDEEIALWKKGTPSVFLRYELSFWSDLAKLMMLWEEEKIHCKLDFTYSKGNLPESLIVIFPGMEISFQLNEEILCEIVPFLDSKNSALKVYGSSGNNIEKIIYDESAKSLKIVKNESLQAPDSPVDLAKGQKIGQWIYLDKKGFCLDKGGSVLDKTDISRDEISSFLDKYVGEFKDFFDGAKINEEVIEASYDLDFDEAGNLKISCYAFSPEDLELSGSCYFGDWIYLRGKGFYRFNDSRFEDINVVIPKERVSDFVSEHKHWLNTQEGYEVQLSSVASKVSFDINEKGGLYFFSDTDIKNDGVRVLEFDSWIYVPKEGFYARKSVNPEVSVLLGQTVANKEIAQFINKNKSTLECIDSFFCSQCPIIKAKLQLEFYEGKMVKVSPEYVLHEGYDLEGAIFFDNFLFVKDHGFSYLSKLARLPQKFLTPQVFEGDALHDFLKYEITELLPYIEELDPGLTKIDNLKIEAVSIHSEQWDSSGLIGLKIFCFGEESKVNVTHLWKAAQKKKKVFFSSNGYIDVCQKRLFWLHRLDETRVDLRKNQLFLSVLELIQLCATGVLEIKGGSSGKSILELLSETIVAKKPELKGLKGDLRGYQKTGVEWLWQLYQYRLSCLLCDDMGLGKTHQAMGLIEATYNKISKQKNVMPLFLIVCPTSVVFHWQEKLKKFLPHIPVFIFYGYKRSWNMFMAYGGIVLTSYGVLRIEKDKLAQINFEVAIFDEIQAAKNSRSQTFAALAQLSSRMRVGLSGTPIENNLRELKTLFDIVLPGYMPKDQQYDKYFVGPIEKEQDREKQAKLSALVKPFMLRRKKEEVLEELPEKMTEIASCALSEKQKELYNQTIAKAQNLLVEELNKPSGPNYIHVFSVLTKLKQICNHPAVFLKDPASYEEYSSGKWDLFVELLQEARASKQKVVVFSHYLDMLSILSRHLRKNGIKFAIVKGDTTDRADQMRIFNEDPECEVFLGSLQAIGMGVDLTAASVVIHYDRWWNAARENQATDRVHRIGQSQGVQVFKFITKGTIEEKIDKLITKKSKMLENVVGYDEQNTLKTLSPNALLDLLRPI